jgi:hypothetical protein
MFRQGFEFNWIWLFDKTGWLDVSPESVAQGWLSLEQEKVWQIGPLPKASSNNLAKIIF